MTDTSHEKALAQKLAEELIISIKAKVAPRAVLLETRIEKALDYLNSVDSANAATLRHARRFLDGEHQWLERGMTPMAGFEEIAARSVEEVERPVAAV